MAIDFSTFTEAQRAAMDKWLPETEYLMDNLAMALEGADPAAVKGWYLRWGTELDNLPTYKAKLGGVKGILTNPITAPYKEGVTLAAAKWLDDNNPNILDANGKPFTLGFYKDIFSGDAATQKTNTDALDAVRKSNATDYVNKTLNAKGTLDAKTIASSIDEIINGTTAKPYTPTKLSTATSAVRGTAAYTPGTKTFDQLKATYGGLLTSSGKPVFSDEDLKAVANANSLGAISKFNTKLNSLADSVLKSQGSSYVTADPAEIQASRQALFKDPAKFVTSVNGLNKTNLGTPSTLTGGSGIDTLTGGSGIDTLTPAKSLKTWKAPQQGVATANSPYSGLLDATLAKVTGANFGTPTNNAVYKNLTDPLTQGMGIDSLPKPKVTYNDTAKAGITGLGDIPGTLQPLNTQVTSAPTYNSNQIANANTALENAADIAGKVVDTGKVVDPGKVVDTLTGGSGTDRITALAKDDINVADRLAEQKRTITFINENAGKPEMATAVANAKAYLEGVNEDIKKFAPNLVATNIAPSFSFTQSEYIAPPTRATLLSSGQVIDPRTKAQIEWSAGQDASRATTNNGIGSLTQANLEASAQNAGYQGYLGDTAAMQDFLNSKNVSVQDYTGLYAEQQAINKAAAEQKAIEDARLAALARNPDGGPSSLAPSNNITYGPQQVTLNPNTVVTPSGIDALSAQTVAANNTYGPQPQPQPVYADTVNPSNKGIVGTIDPATLSVANMNSNAGGLPSLMGPFPNTGATVQQQPTVIQQPAVTQQLIPPDTRVFDTAGNVVAGKRKLIV